MFEIGTKVRLKKDLKRVGTIESIYTQFGDVVYYNISFIDESKVVSENSLLTYNDQKSVKDNLVSGHFGSYHDFQKIMTHIKLHYSDVIQNNIYSFNTSRTIFYEYQFKPLLKFISSYKRRLLICDEVGLGKTVEAGLILKELEARKMLKNVIIVVPANLRGKWKWEMKNRFSENFNILSKSEFEKLLNLDDSIKEKFRDERYIVSMESIRRKETMNVISSSDYRCDLLIVDEAHSVRNMSQQHSVIKALSYLCNSVIFLTATPLQTSNENLFNVLNILDEQQFPYFESFNMQLSDNTPLVRALNYISSSPPDISKAYIELCTLKEQFKDNLIYDDLVANLQEVNSLKADVSISLEKIIDIQRNLSELHLLGNVLTRTLKRDVHIDKPERCSSTINISITNFEKDLINTIIEAIKQHFIDQDKNYLLPLYGVRRMLSSSIHAHANLFRKRYSLFLPPEDLKIDVGLNSATYNFNHQWFDTLKDSKLDKLLEVLNQIKNNTSKVIIFAFFIPTLKYLYDNLNGICGCTFKLIGEVPILERENIINQFKHTEDFAILLSSRVGSEGIDLQFCNTIINYDLPWNPMEIEQRIGRIDRIGQKSPKIFIYNFGVDDTIDDNIILRLYERIQLFENSIGLLEPILGDFIEEVKSEIFFQELTDEQKKKKWYEKEKILIAKTKDIKLLEDKSNELLSLDYFFLHEIKSIRNKKRYIAPEHLYRYILGFINEKFPDSRIRYDFKVQVGEITLCDKFRLQILKTEYKDELLYFCMRNKRIRFTLDSTVAFQEPDIVFINILHPLVKYITEQYNIEPQELFNCNFFYVDKQELIDEGVHLENGYYFYFVYMFSIEGFQKSSLLVPIILNESLESIGDVEHCEHVLGVILEKGRTTIQGIECNDKEYLENSYNKARKVFEQVFLTYTKRFEAKHKMVLKREMDSTIFNFSRRKDMLNAELANIVVKSNLSEGVLFRRKMIEAKLNKLALELEEQKIKIDINSECYSSFDEPKIGGVFEIINSK